MDKLLRTADQIAKKMKEKGYKYFNIKDGITGTDFKTGIESYLLHANSSMKEPAFPIYAGLGSAPMYPDQPFSWISFKIVEDNQRGLRIDSMNISMQEGNGSSLRTSLDLKINALEDIPSKQFVAKLIEEKWEKFIKERLEGQKKQEQNAKPVTKVAGKKIQNSKGRKM